MNGVDNMRNILRCWGLELKVVREDIPLYGSPERCCLRMAVEDVQGRVWVAEQIERSRCADRALIARILAELSAGGLKRVNPYLATVGGEFISIVDGNPWQLSSYVSGTPLDRPRYICDAGKGEALAGFLCDLYEHAPKSVECMRSPSFSLKDYIIKTKMEMDRHDPKVARRFSPVFDHIARSFFDGHDMLPVLFCHGDYHPLNVIWRTDSIAAVIDWEFCGTKIETYDIANLAGCVGMEHPSGLVGDLLVAFIRRMRRSSAISEEGWRLLPDTVIALRVAWLAEWLRKKDHEMVDLELVYMNLLVENRKKLEAAWAL